MKDLCNSEFKLKVKKQKSLELLGKVWQLFKYRNYSSAETIQGRKLIKGGNYSRKYGTYLKELEL